MPSMSRVVGLTLGSTYIVVVAVTATVGFSTDSTRTILIAAALGLPSSLFAVPAFYAAFGLLALVPGANPSSSSGSGYCTRDGDCEWTSTGDPAAWFLPTTDVLGIVALTGAALLNVVLLTLLIRVARRPGRGDLVAEA